MAKATCIVDCDAAAAALVVCTCHSIGALRNATMVYVNVLVACGCPVDRLTMTPYGSAACYRLGRTVSEIVNDGVCYDNDQCVLVLWVYLKSSVRSQALI